MPAPKHKETFIEDFLQTLPNGKANILRQMALDGDSDKDILVTLEAEGCRLGLTYVRAWIRSLRPDGKLAVEHNQELEQYQGARINTALSGKVVYSLAKTLDKAMKVLDTVDPNRIAPHEWLRATPQLARELTNLTKVQNEILIIEDRKQLVFAGAFRMQQEILETFKDNPLLYEAIQEAAKTAMMVIEEGEY